MAEEEVPVSYEELALLEDDFEAVDNEIMRKQYELSAPLFARRAAAVAKIENFWSLALEQAPLDVDQFIHTHDSSIFAESLETLDVTRPEVSDPNGSPRTMTIRFTFKPNDFFEDTVLEKHFWYRRAREGWTGLVSEPVKVHWKADKDLTEGLTDGAVALWQARSKSGDMLNRDLPEYKALAEKVEQWGGANTSFFTWFGWVSSRRWISAEESVAANKEYESRKEARKRGEKMEMKEDEEKDEDEDVDDDANDDSAVEVHEMGEDLAVSIAEDIWPNAIKYFTDAQEMEDIGGMLEDDDDDDEDMDDGEEEVDIRQLVEESKPPSKKRKN